MKTILKAMIAVAVLLAPLSLAIAADDACAKCCKGKCGECKNCKEGKCDECCK